MITVDDLRQCFKLNMEIRAIEEMLEGLRNDRQRITRNYNSLGVQSSNKFDFTNLIDLIVDLEAASTSKLFELAQLKGACFVKIDKLADVRYRTVLINRYINGLSWDEVARAMNYGFDYVFRLHRNAIRKFGEM